jgi:hypothetical protein
MKLGIAKRFACEVEVFNGDKIIDKYIAIENDLVTNNPLGHRPLQNIDFKDKKVETVKYKT